MHSKIKNKQQCINTRANEKKMEGKKLKYFADFNLRRR